MTETGKFLFRISGVTALVAAGGYALYRVTGGSAAAAAKAAAAKASAAQSAAAQAAAAKQADAAFAAILGTTSAAVVAADLGLSAPVIAGADTATTAAWGTQTTAQKAAIWQGAGGAAAGLPASKGAIAKGPGSAPAAGPNQNPTGQAAGTPVPGQPGLIYDGQGGITAAPSAGTSGMALQGLFGFDMLGNLGAGPASGLVNLGEWIKVKLEYFIHQSMLQACSAANAAAAKLKAAGAPIPGEWNKWSCDQKVAFLAALGPAGIATIIAGEAVAALTVDVWKAGAPGATKAAQSALNAEKRAQKVLEAAITKSVSNLSRGLEASAGQALTSAAQSVANAANQAANAAANAASQASSDVSKAGKTVAHLLGLPDALNDLGANLGRSLSVRPISRHHVREE